MNPDHKRPRLPPEKGKTTGNQNGFRPLRQTERKYHGVIFSARKAAAFSGVRFISAPNAAADEYSFVTGYMSGEELKARTAGMSVLARYRVLD